MKKMTPAPSASDKGSSAGGRAPWAPLISVIECWRLPSCTDLAQVINQSRHEFMSQWPGHVQRTVFHGAPLALTSFPSPCDAPGGLGLGVIWMSYLGLSCQQSVTYSQDVYGLWISTVTIVYFRQKLLWPRQTAALIYRYKWNYLESDLTSCPFSKTTTLGCLGALWPLQPWTLELF